MWPPIAAKMLEGQTVVFCSAPVVSDIANVHFEVIESPQPLLAHAGTVNPHQFLETPMRTPRQTPAGCFRG